MLIAQRGLLLAGWLLLLPRLVLPGELSRALLTTASAGEGPDTVWTGAQSRRWVAGVARGTRHGGARAINIRSG